MVNGQNGQNWSKRSKYKLVQNGAKDEVKRPGGLLVIQYFSSSWLQIEMLKGETHLRNQNKSSQPIFEVFFFLCSGNEQKGGLNISLETHNFFFKRISFIHSCLSKLIILVKRSESKASHPPEETQTSAKRKRGTFRNFHLFIKSLMNLFCSIPSTADKNMSIWAKYIFLVNYGRVWQFIASASLVSAVCLSVELN